MPSDNGLWLDDDESGTPAAPARERPAPEELINDRQFRPLCRAMQDAELVTESEGLKLKGRIAAERLSVAETP